MSPKNKKIAILVGLVVVVAAGVFLVPRLFAPDFRKELASKLNVDAEFLHLNIPPAAKREPGFTFMMKGSIIPIMFPPEDAGDMETGEGFDLEWGALTKSDATGGVGAGLFDTLFKQESLDKISLRATECRILELPLQKVRERLLESDEVVKAADAKTPVFVIIRSYMGKIEMKITKDSKTSGTAWTEKVEEAEGIAERAGKGNLGITSKSDRDMIITWQTPTVFAYEAMEANLLTTHLGSDPNEVELKPVTKEQLTVAMKAASTEGSVKKN